MRLTRDEASGIDFATLCQIGDAVGGSECEGLDGFSWLATAGGNEAAAVTEEKILHVVRAMIGVDDGRLRVVAHTAGAEHGEGELLLLNGQTPFLFRAGSVKDGKSLLIHKTREL